jgi:hypothetical protein
MRERSAEVVFYEWGITRWLTSKTRMQLDCAGRSIYRELIDLCYAQGTIPKDPKILMRHCGASQEEWDRTWPLIARHFHQAKHDSEALSNDQADVFRLNYFKYCAEQREKGKKGGRPKSNVISKMKTNGLCSGSENEKPDETQPTNVTNEHKLTNVVGGGGEAAQYSEMAAAMRTYFPATDDALVVVTAIRSMQAYASVVSGHGKSPPLTDAILAEAVHEAKFKDQYSPGPFKESVPRVVKSWAEEAIRKGLIH